MVRFSAGLLPYRRTDHGIEVFLAHPGGPFWARKDEHVWSVTKGEYDPATEAPRCAAAREFVEEIGVPAPPQPWLELGEIRQSSGKRVVAYAVEDASVQFVASNEIDIQWPPRSGKMLRIPEVDRAQFWPVQEARHKLIASQVPLLDRLCALLAA
ncbi:NUDIX domain-containing protein [Gephyromycinifex aptenodytis]|uniref:NUDIX domain-containing protein n=1 Tax=Gephyromycinifex aptenodytis TaxID=2716227 RepID=UPI001447F80A|nr:NUDIX domain-containing protein [Gephyromycinifex aptenodytis]